MTEVKEVDGKWYVYEDGKQVTAACLTRKTAKQREWRYNSERDKAKTWELAKQVMAKPWN